MAELDFLQLVGEAGGPEPVEHDGTLEVNVGHPGLGVSTVYLETKLVLLLLDILCRGPGNLHRIEHPSSLLLGLHSQREVDVGLFPDSPDKSTLTVKDAEEGINTTVWERRDNEAADEWGQSGG